MGGIQRQTLRESRSVAVCQEFHENLEEHWVSKRSDHYNVASSTSSFEDSSVSSGSLSSIEDACSSTSNTSSESSGPLEDFTELLAQLPIK